MHLIQIPGNQTHELPPLLVHSAYGSVIAESVDEFIGEAEEMLPPADVQPESRLAQAYDLALQLREWRLKLLAKWFLGDSILEWIRQCEITFGYSDDLRKLLYPDVWPHAEKASFVELLKSKEVPTRGIDLEQAVGLRVSFRAPDFANSASSQFAFYLNGPAMKAVYQDWSRLNVLLPPERFHFEVADVNSRL